MKKIFIVLFASISICTPFVQSGLFDHLRSGMPYSLHDRDKVIESFFQTAMYIAIKEALPYEEWDKSDQSLTRSMQVQSSKSWLEKKDQGRIKRFIEETNKKNNRKFFELAFLKINQNQKNLGKALVAYLQETLKQYTQEELIDCFHLDKKPDILVRFQKPYPFFACFVIDAFLNLYPEDISKREGFDEVKKYYKEQLVKLRKHSRDALAKYNEKSLQPELEKELENEVPRPWKVDQGPEPKWVDQVIAEELSNPKPENKGEPQPEPGKPEPSPTTTVPQPPPITGGQGQQPEPGSGESASLLKSVGVPILGATAVIGAALYLKHRFEKQRYQQKKTELVNEIKKMRAANPALSLEFFKKLIENRGKELSLEQQAAILNEAIANSTE